MAVTNSFVLNKYWTFSDSGNQGVLRRQFTMFLLLGLVGLAISNAVVWFLAYAVPEIAAKVLSVGALFVWNYATSRLIVFRANKPETD